MPAQHLLVRSPVAAATLRQASGGRLALAGASLLDLQRRYGNRYVQQVVNFARRSERRDRRSAVPDLLLGQRNDESEREADRLARQATSRRAGHLEPDAEGPVAPLLRVPRTAGASPGGGGRPLDRPTRLRMERAFRADLRSVRVHLGPDVDELNQALQSRAFTVGADVFFLRGEYRPGTASGDELLAHELTHTLQQAGSSAARGQAAAAPMQVRSQVPGNRISLKRQKAHLDFVRMKRQDADIKRVIARKLGMNLAEGAVEQAGFGTYGHWWTEVGILSEDGATWTPRASYGWWPDPDYGPTSVKEVWGGVPGLLNGEGPESEHDGHEGDPAPTEFHPVMEVETDDDYVEVRRDVTKRIKDFAKGYTGKWNWRLGWGKNCQTFQQAMKTRLGLHYTKSRHWLIDPRPAQKAAAVEAAKATAEVLKTYTVPGSRKLEANVWDGSKMAEVGSIGPGQQVGVTGKTMKYTWPNNVEYTMVEFVVAGQRRWVDDVTWKHIFGEPYQAGPSAEELEAFTRMAAMMRGRGAPPQ